MSFLPEEEEEEWEGKEEEEEEEEKEKEDHVPIYGNKKQAAIHASKFLTQPTSISIRAPGGSVSNPPISCVLASRDTS